MWRLAKEPGILFFRPTSNICEVITFRNRKKLDVVRLYSTGKIQGVEEWRIPKYKKEIGGMGWFLSLVPIGAFCLGTWQVKRKKWKEQLMEDLRVKTRCPPVELPSEDSEMTGLEYRRVAVQGEFDHSREMYIGLRSLLKDGESTYHGKLISSTSNTSSGYYVVTPFTLSHTKERILVNRGWVPMSNKSPRGRPEGQVEGEVELTGVVRLSEPRAPFMPHNKPQSNTWITRDVELMSQTADTRPVYIDATEDSTVEGGPIGGQTRVTLRNEHLSYIITWYSLSAATAFMWYTKYLK